MLYNDERHAGRHDTVRIPIFGKLDSGYIERVNTICYDSLTVDVNMERYIRALLAYIA